ncbi:STAS/SEC14 domain-containing protein [Microbacterium sp. B2969]|uniref:STAS/SEC14 domain-containing protein n=1 Tax=Microbacterium alkaliflavum TaxID=3248839 RepID=A0ABW7Q3Q6_9MICO
MIDPIPDLPPGVLGFRAVGVVEASDYRSVLDPAIDAAVAKGQKLNIVFVLGEDFSRYSLSALWQDVLLEGKPEGSWGRVALVTNRKVLGEMVHGLGFLMPAEFRLFALADLQTAIDWAAGEKVADAEA